MAERIEGAKPTRMELLSIKKRMMLAKKGDEILTKKRDALVSEFFEIIKERSAARKEAFEALAKARKSLLKAEMVMGRDAVQSVAFGVPEIDDVEIRIENIMGVRIPRFSAGDVEKSPTYGLAGTSAFLDSARLDFIDALEKLLKLAEIESSIERMAKEIESTKRRVNALEYVFIPRLEATAKYIEMQLEEREREDFVRRKRIKAMMESE
jgi:V/A-type H+-transporting ATPase subunit D